MDKKLFCLHLFLFLASAQWWGLQRGFRPRGAAAGFSPGRIAGAQRGVKVQRNRIQEGRIGFQRTIGVPNQPTGGFQRPSSRAFFGGPSSSNYGPSRVAAKPVSASSDTRSRRQKLESPPTRSSSSNEIDAARNSKKAFTSKNLQGNIQKNATKVTEGWRVPPSLKQPLIRTPDIKMNDGPLF